jgi:glutathionyl-hydroquinone reductase
MGIGVLIDGKWIVDNEETYRKGDAFVRATTAFRAFVTADGSSGLKEPKALLDELRA